MSGDGERAARTHRVALRAAGEELGRLGLVVIEGKGELAALAADHLGELVEMVAGEIGLVALGLGAGVEKGLPVGSLLRSRRAGGIPVRAAAGIAPALGLSPLWTADGLARLVLGGSRRAGILDRIGTCTLGPLGALGGLIGARVTIARDEGLDRKLLDRVLARALGHLEQRGGGKRCAVRRALSRQLVLVEHQLRLEQALDRVGVLADEVGEDEAHHRVRLGLGGGVGVVEVSERRRDGDER